MLSALDDKIELNRQICQTLEEMASTLFQSWFVDFEPVRAKAAGKKPEGLAADIAELFPDSFVDSELGEIPKGWEFVSVDDMIKFNPSYHLALGQKAPYLAMSALPTSGSRSEPPIFRDFTSGQKFKNGDALLARITPCLENGKAAFIQNLDDDAIGWGSTEFIVMRSKSPMPLAYAYIVARDKRFKSQAINSMTGTSGRQRVQLSSLTKFIVAKPNLKVAKAFEESITPLFTKIVENDREIHTLTQTRDALLPKLISGELRVREYEKRKPE